MGAHKSNPFANHTNVSRAMRARDCFNRVLTEGDEILLQEPLKLPSIPRYTVRQIIPNLAPNAQPNTLRMLVVMEVMIILGADQAFSGLMRVRTAAEIADVEGRPKPVITDPDDDDALEPPPAPPSITEN